MVPCMFTFYFTDNSHSLSGSNRRYRVRASKVATDATPEVFASQIAGDGDSDDFAYDDVGHSKLRRR